MNDEIKKLESSLDKIIEQDRHFNVKLNRQIEELSEQTVEMKGLVESLSKKIENNSKEG